MSNRSGSFSNVPDSNPGKEIWDDYWRRGEPGYASHNSIIERALEHTDGKDSTIAEIGAGAGVDAIALASKGHTVIAVDISMESLRLIKSKIGDKSLPVIPVNADALFLPFKDGSMDLIYHQGVMEHFKDPLPFLSQQKRALKKGGRLLVDVPQTFTIYTLKKKWAMARNRWFAGWETEYSPARLRRILKRAGWRVIDLYGRDSEFLLFIWLRDIDTLGKTRFGRPILPRFIRGPVGKLWRFFESLEFSNYIKLCIGAVVMPDENRD